MLEPAHMDRFPPRMSKSRSHGFAIGSCGQQRCHPDLWREPALQWQPNSVLSFVRTDPSSPGERRHFEFGLIEEKAG